MVLSGSPFDYLIAFAGGFLASLTPCVYPLIPVTAGYIGINSSGSKLKGFFLGLAYVTGIAIMYSTLGVIAALSGKIFGTIATSPLMQIIAGAVIIIFGLAMFDLFALPLPSAAQLPKLKRGDYFSTLLLGLVSGLIVGPCLTPVLGAILVYVAARESMFYGVTLLFSFAFGMGLIFIVIGVFSSVLVSLPKSGRWMAYIKRIFAILLIALGIYFIFSGIWGA
ncbi:MAG: hypothetical protein FJZ15_01535 [Candidatus Omnitrophica bacterium]|nr:hypothetical protein [Candidatus Omnitrophota bacterium]